MVNGAVGRPLGPRLFAAALSLVPACSQGLPPEAVSGASRGQSTAPSAAPVVVTRGTLEDRVVLTGELEAISAEKLVVPRTPTWVLTLHYLAEDGSLVKKGDKVVEFDPSSLTGNIEDKRLAIIRAENDLQSADAQAASDMAEKTMTVDKERAALETAIIDAKVPAELLPQQDYQKRQQTLLQKRDSVAKAEEALLAAQRAAQFEKTTKTVALARAQKDLDNLNRRLEELTLRASADGYLQVEKNNQGRKYMVGDQVYSSWLVATIPQAGAMQVRARLSDADDGAVRVGMPADVVLDSYPDRKWSGQVISISPVARNEVRDSPRRSFEVVISLHKLDSAIMRPGMSARVEVLRHRAADALIVPRVALRTFPGKSEVRLLDGTVQPLVVDFCSELSCVVEGGVLDGSRLLARTADEKGAP